MFSGTPGAIRERVFTIIEFSEWFLNKGAIFHKSYDVQGNEQI
jgi:hypothetical protein